MSTPLWVTTTRGDTVGTATVTAADDTFTLAAHGLVDGQQVTVSGPTGGAVGVLVVDAPYFVAAATTDTFQLRPSPGAPIMTVETDGSAVVHQVAGQFAADTLRNAISGLLARGDVAGGFGARPGVLPNGTPDGHVTTAGMQWQTTDMVAVVEHDTGGMYLVAHPAESGPVTAADPSLPRIDALDLQIQDTAVDGSGLALARLVYTAGVPASVPTAPAEIASAERLSTWRVEAGATGTNTPTTPRFTVARGGIIPVASSADYPGQGGRYDGLPVWNRETETLEINTNAGSVFEPIASTTSFHSTRRVATSVRTTGSGTFASESVVDSVDADVEAGKTYRIWWDVGVSSTVAGDMARLRIREDLLSGTIIKQRHLPLPRADDQIGSVMGTDWTAPASGTQTFVGTVHRHFGTGDFTSDANASVPSSIIVEYVSG